MLPKAPPPTLRLTVDPDALSSNWKALDARSGPAEAGAAVKADAYGLGVDRCVPVLRDAGCRSFFVAHWNEVGAVAKHVPCDQIAVLHGVLTKHEMDFASAMGVTPVINSLEQARAWIDHGGGTCDLMIDTGINRLGIEPGELSDQKLQELEVGTLMSHLACADEDSPMNRQQLDLFQSCLGRVEHQRQSLANSAGVALGQDYGFDLTRPGLALYGGVPRPELEDDIQQVAFLEAAVIQTREIMAGDAVGYNAEFVACTSIKVGTVSLGYADGFLRSRGPNGALIADGERLPILGKVSMDMVVVDLSAAPHIKEGDWLKVPFDLPNAARQSALSQYELLTVLGSRWG
ncbi:MAG: alanine racemase [Pseudomonadota bacterium]